MAGKSRPCTVLWCDQGGRPHTLHEATLGTWNGDAFRGVQRLVNVQVVVHGYGDDDVVPMVSLVDSSSLEQVDSVLDWEEAMSLGSALVDAVTRLRPRRSS